MADLESYFGTVKNDTNVADANKVVDGKHEQMPKVMIIVWLVRSCCSTNKIS